MSDSTKSISVTDPAQISAMLRVLQNLFENLDCSSLSPSLTISFSSQEDGELRLALDDYLLTIFPDGRAIIGGTDDIATARTLYAKYIGN